MNDERQGLLARRQELMIKTLERLIPRIRVMYVAGGLLVLLGSAALASAMVSKVDSLVPIGIFMVVGGLFEMGVGHVAREEDGAPPPFMLSGAAHMIAGFTAMFGPLLPGYALTSILGTSLAFAGVTWMRAGFALPQTVQAPVVALSGGITGLAGLLILSRWAGDNHHIMALLLGGEMMLRGWAWFAFALTLQRVMRK
ncbi:MAG: hypothetical protein AB7F96_01845 [Beijerinckiaceae bacterium]